MTAFCTAFFVESVYALVTAVLRTRSAALTAAFCLSNAAMSAVSRVSMSGFTQRNPLTPLPGTVVQVFVAPVLVAPVAVEPVDVLPVEVSPVEVSPDEVSVPVDVVPVETVPEEVVVPASSALAPNEAVRPTATATAEAKRNFFASILGYGEKVKSVTGL